MVIAFEKGPSGRIRGLREKLTGLTAQDVETAINEFSLDEAALHGYCESTDYDLIYKGRAFPPKAVFGLAASRIAGRPLNASEFSGGYNSQCFSILRSLGYKIESKAAQAQPNYFSPSLTRGHAYDRQEISQIFEQGFKFTRGSGRWGIPDIVEVPPRSGNFVFFVTLGNPHDGNPYQDSLTEDGYLIRQSQTRQLQKSPVIQKLLSHDPKTKNIHLFLRGNAQSKYTYIGLLDYFSHNPVSNGRVHFIWKILNWDFNARTLTGVGIQSKSRLDPTYTPQQLVHTIGGLHEEPPPKREPVRSRTVLVKKKVSESVKATDWAARDARNKDLGLAGEKLVIKHEIDQLTTAGRPDLATLVKHVALVNSAAGYDIASFSPEGSPKRIEVKTTLGPKTSPFYISINEILVAREDPSSYWIYRVFNFNLTTGTAKFFQMNGDVEDSCDLTPTNFRAVPGKND